MLWYLLGHLGGLTFWGYITLISIVAVITFAVDSAVRRRRERAARKAAG